MLLSTGSKPGNSSLGLQPLAVHPWVRGIRQGPASEKPTGQGRARAHEMTSIVKCHQCRNHGTWEVPLEPKEEASTLYQETMGEDSRGQ